MYIHALKREKISYLEIRSLIPPDINYPLLSCLDIFLGYLMKMQCRIIPRIRGAQGHTAVLRCILFLCGGFVYCVISHCCYLSAIQLAQLASF